MSFEPNDQNNLEHGRRISIRTRVLRQGLVFYGVAAIVGGAVYMAFEYFSKYFSLIISVGAMVLGVVLLIVQRYVKNLFPLGYSEVGEQILSDVDAAKVEKKARREGDGADEAGEFDLDVDDIFNLFRNRMVREIFRLQGTARLNLILGVVFSAVGAGWLIFYSSGAIKQMVGAYSVMGVDKNFLSLMFLAAIPRILIGVLVSAVGYFFLRLYMSNEMDIKHTKNEITNVELKVIALKTYRDLVSEAAILKERSAGAGSLNLVLKSFADVERNYIDKGKLSVSRESAKELIASLDIISALAAKIPTLDKLK